MNLLIHDKFIKLIGDTIKEASRTSCFKCLRKRSAKTKWKQQLMWLPASDRATGWQEAVEKGGAGVCLWQKMAGWVSPGTLLPVLVYLKSFAWLIRDDRTAAPNLQSAVTRGQWRRQTAPARTHDGYMPLHSAVCTSSRKWCGAEFNSPIISIILAVRV